MSLSNSSEAQSSAREHRAAGAVKEYAAIATGGYKGKGTDSGKPFDEHLRWTDTWVKMPNGKWQLVASHYSSVK